MGEAAMKNYRALLHVTRTNTRLGLSWPTSPMMPAEFRFHSDDHTTSHAAMDQSTTLAATSIRTGLIFSMRDFLHHISEATVAQRGGSLTSTGRLKAVARGLSLPLHAEI